MSETARPLSSLILMIVAVLVALAIFWVGFMLAPAAVLLISYLALSAGERADRQRRLQASPLESPLELVSAPAGVAGDRDGQAEDPPGQAKNDRDGQSEDRWRGQTDMPYPAGNQPKGVRA
jgi:hypothetical protein